MATRRNTCCGVPAKRCSRLIRWDPCNDLARESHGRLKTMLGDGTESEVLFTAVLDELMVPPAPSLLILEDIHWADAATLDLIKFLGRRIHRAPALMIL